MANFQPDTEYLLVSILRLEHLLFLPFERRQQQIAVFSLQRYELYENAVMTNREPKGIIMVRLRMELKEERDLILSNLQLPPEFFVNVKEAKDFDLV